MECSCVVVVGWARAEGRLTKQCFCYFTSPAPQRESLFFLGAFRLSETSFFAVFCCFFWRGVGWRGWGGWGGGVITFFGPEHIWDGTS